MNKKIAVKPYIHLHIPHWVLRWLAHWSGEKLISFRLNCHTIVPGTNMKCARFIIVKYKIMING